MDDVFHVGPDFLVEVLESEVAVFPGVVLGGGGEVNAVDLVAELGEQEAVAELGGAGDGGVEDVGEPGEEGLAVLRGGGHGVCYCLEVFCGLLIGCFECLKTNWVIIIM